MSEYILKSGRATAKVISRGAELASFIPSDGRERIWTGDPAVWSGHSPILFPVVGSLTDDKVLIDGKPYSMPKHGLIRKREFTLGRHGEDFVEMTIDSDADTLAAYPFEFTVHVIHSITEKGFETVFLVENKSGRPMPMCIGGHPGFMCPVFEGEAFEDYRLKFECDEDGENSLAPNGYIITGTERMACFHNTDTLALDHELFDTHDALILTNLKSRSVRLVHKDTGHGVKFDFPKFDALGVWSAPGKNAPYVCLEPWSGIPALASESGNFEDKPFVKWIPAGECYRTGFRATLI